MPRNAKSEASRRLKAALYIRVSTLYQVDKDSLPMQRKDLTSYASLMLGIEDCEIFEDAGYSGKNVDRPAFQEMMSRIRKGEFSHILVWKIDRISRNLLDFAEMYQELQRLRVTFVSKNEQFDTSTAIGEAMLKIILVFAELERNMTAERVTAAMISRASSGLWNGGRIPYGYAYDREKNVFSIVDHEADVLRKIRDHYVAHKSVIQTVKMMNATSERPHSGKDWTSQGIWKFLSSPFYAGIYRYNRYKGTNPRVTNAEDQWVMIYDHHPAIFSVEEYEQVQRLLQSNKTRDFEPVGSTRMGKYFHVFGGLAYCGKCGAMMFSNPGRTHADGYRTSTYTCPKFRTTKECDNPSIADVIVGEFVINYILNMLNAKKTFSRIQSVSDLEKRLLSGSAFSDVARIDPTGLADFYNLLSRYKSDDSFRFSVAAPKKKKAAADPEVAALRRQAEKEERALKRLQELYLYSDDSMSEKDFIVQKSRIIAALQEIRSKLGMIHADADNVLSDEDFVRQASHLLISKQLQGRSYIYYKNLARDVSPEVLKAYMETIIDSILITDGRVTAITFKNGLTHRFVYERKKALS